jgi:hypothetical protein
MGLDHHVENLLDVGLWNAFVEEVAHGVHEDPPRTTPAQRLLELVLDQSEIEAVLKRMAGHSSKPFREGFGIAVLAPWAYL